MYNVQLPMHKCCTTAFPGVQETMRLEKMNHFQVRNSSETAIGLNALFNGTIVADEETRKFFKTDKKQ